MVFRGNGFADEFLQISENYRKSKISLKMSFSLTDKKVEEIIGNLKIVAEI